MATSRAKAASIEFTEKDEALRSYYKINRVEYFKDCLRVKDRTGKGVVPLEPFPGQLALMHLRDDIQRFHEEIAKDVGTEDIQQICIMVGKARRGGFSTVIEGEMLHYCEHNPGSNGLVVAHAAANADNIAQISRRFCQQFPEELEGIKVPMQKLGQELEWGEVNKKPWDSRIVVATVNSKNFARSFDFSFVHLSECAHYGNSDAVAAAKDAAQFAKIIYEESTANGMDPFFYYSWQKAMPLEEVRNHWRKNKTLPEEWNGKYRFFWAWHNDSAYMIPLSSEQKLSILNNLTNDEEEGIRLYGWSPEQIEWRRRKISGSCSEQNELEPLDYFKQEYPSSPEEMFVSTGNAVFPTDSLLNMKKTQGFPIKHGSLKAFDRNGAVIQISNKKRLDQSNLLIWSEPRQKKQYVIGSAYKDGGKGAVVVFDRTDGTAMIEVASYYGTCTGMELGDICAWFGFKYNGAFIIPEATAPATAQQLTKRQYPFIYMRKNEEKVGVASRPTDQYTPGFRAVSKNRLLILHHSQDAFRRKEVVLRNPELISQHINFALVDNEMIIPNGDDDSGLIATALAVFAHRNAAPKIIVKREDFDIEGAENKVAKNSYELSIRDAIHRKKVKSEKKHKKMELSKRKSMDRRLKDLFK